MPVNGSLLNNQILSFHDLRDPIWNNACDRGSVEDFATEKLDPAMILFYGSLVCLASEFCATATSLSARAVSKDPRLLLLEAARGKPQEPVSLIYRATHQQAKRNVFKGYPRKDGGGISDHRHAAFEGHFRRFSDMWFLDITPTFVFTHDGEKISRYHADLLSGIKRLDRNPAVLAWVMMWADYLSRRGDLFTPDYPFFVLRQTCTTFY